MKRFGLAFLNVAMVLLLLAGCGGGGGSSTTPTDTTAPSTPAGLVAAPASSSSIALNWTASTDSTGVTGYKIYRGGTYLKSATAISSSDTGLTASTQYCYQVSAYDAAGNESAKSTQTCAKTTAIVPGANFKMPDTNQTTSYTNTFGEDHDYTINPPSYTDNGNGTITDNVTGLVWQKQDDGLGKDWANSIAYCDNLSLGGQTGWRLPSLFELISIIDNGVSNPAINTTFFTNTLSDYYWSSTADALDTLNARPVVFIVGFSFSAPKTMFNYARCVR